jgi:hypothetical protein
LISTPGSLDSVVDADLFEGKTPFSDLGFVRFFFMAVVSFS